MRSIFCLLALASLTLAPAASAQIRFLPYIGYNTSIGVDFEESVAQGEAVETGGFLVGVAAEYGLTPGFLPFAIKIRPSVETVFLPDGSATITAAQGGGTATFTQSAIQANLDLVAAFSPPLAPVGIFGGIGAALVSFHSQIEETAEEANDTAFGGNAFAGVRFGGGFVQPFVQGRYTLLTVRPGEGDLDPGEEFDDANAIHGGFSVLAGVSLGL